MIALASLGDALDAAQDQAAGLTDWLTRVASAVTAVDLALLAIAAIALLWVGSSLYAEVNLGAIEVVPLEHDDETAANLRALTADFRERLDKVGLPPPPAVPAGSPQADVITAIEAAPLPQGAFVAKLLEILPTPPRPRQFRVTGTLRGDEQPAASLAWRKPNCSISFMLQPLGVGAATLRTIAPPFTTHGAALELAARMIYREIACTTPGVFPGWARWGSIEALEMYESGCAHRDAARRANARPSAEAMHDLCAAAELSPSNALAQLELGNLEELLGGVVEDDGLTARLRANALRRYLTVAEQWPQILEARYRASVLAGVLARSYQDLPLTQQLDVQAAVGLVVRRRWQFEKHLNQLATRESRATRQMLRRWFTLVRDQRLRNPFEWRGRQCVALGHTVQISRHCAHARRLIRVPHSRRNDILHYSLVFYRSVAVHVRHLVLGKGRLTWQAYYNAACFDTLLLTGNWAIRRDTTRRRALRNLRVAVRESDGALPYRWAENDPDFAYFARARDARRWRDLIEPLRVDGVGGTLGGAAERAERRAAKDQAETWLARPRARGPRLTRLPDRAWGRPAPRILWCLVSIAVLWTALALWAWAGTVLALGTYIGFAVSMLLVAAALVAAADWVAGHDERKRQFVVGES